MSRKNFLAVLFAIWAVVANAQDTRGVLSGSVTDTSAAVVPDAVVKALNLSTNTSLSSATNDEGNYVWPYLLPGSYRVEAPGFKLASATTSSCELRAPAIGIPLVMVAPDC